MTYRDNPEIAAKYKSKRWKKLRDLKKKLFPFCERCLKVGIYKPTYIAHHKEYITDLNYQDDNVFFNLDNLESLCLGCHNQEHFSEKENYFFDSEGNILPRNGKATPH